jgi:hypothetical protein
MAKVPAALCFLLFSILASAQAPTRFQKDSITAPVSLKYKDPSLLKRLFLGKNYRTVWQTAVTFPVFRIKELGLTIEELGGGQQTKSLQMEDKLGREWVLRTVDKDVEKALPAYLRNTLAQKVTQDMVSAAHPYAPLTIPTLAKAIGVIVPEPTFYYVPDDPALEPYRSIFANTICMLEQREPTPDRSATENTEDLMEELLEQNDHQVIQQAVLKARLLDMLVADWDRHADQWRWGKRDSGSVEYYYAIPRDRDQAYFYSNGLLPRIAKVVALRHLVGFQDDLDQLKNLNHKSWEFDRLFLNQLDRGDWEAIIKSAQAALTDKVIHAAVAKMPPAVYAINGATIENKLKGRRNELLTAGLRYYDYITRYPLISGTEEGEYFKVSGSGDTLLVQVYDLNDNGTEGRKIYERVFRGEETKYLTFQGYGGKDKFEVLEGTSADIRLNFHGGGGADEYTIRGNSKNTIYEVEADNNKIRAGSRTKIRKDNKRTTVAK